MNDPAPRQPRRVAAAASPTRASRPRTICADLRAGELLDASFERRVAPLDARDRRWTQELVYGMLRRRAWLDAMLSERVRGGLARLDPDLTDLLRLGVYQLLCMRSVPRLRGDRADGRARQATARTRREQAGERGAAPRRPRARASSTVTRAGHAARPDRSARARAFAPALARRALGRALGRRATPSGCSPRTTPRRRSSCGRSASCASSSRRCSRAPASTSRKRRSCAIASASPAACRSPSSARSGRDCSSCRIRRRRWSRSTRRSRPGALVADLCAAPGGKALELSRTAGAVIAADRSFARLTRCSRNHPTRGGDERAPARRRRARARASRRWTPCSSTSRARAPARSAAIPTRDGGSRSPTSPSWRRCSASIIRAAADVVRPGGLLVYSTCSLEPEENDAQVDSFLAEHPDWMLEPPPTGPSRPRCSTADGCACCRSGTGPTARSRRGCGGRAGELAGDVAPPAAIRVRRRRRIPPRVPGRRVPRLPARASSPTTRRCRRSSGSCSMRP